MIDTIYETECLPVQCVMIAATKKYQSADKPEDACMGERSIHIYRSFAQALGKAVEKLYSDTRERTKLPNNFYGAVKHKMRDEAIFVVLENQRR